MGGQSLVMTPEQGELLQTLQRDSFRYFVHQINPANGRVRDKSGPLFIHQLSHVWIDFHGIRDAFMREHDLDYFENSRCQLSAAAICHPQSMALTADML